MKLIRKDKLVAQIAKRAKIDTAKATIAYETVLRESPAFRTQSLKTVTAKKEVAVKVPGKTQIKKVSVSKQKAVKTGASVEKIKIVKVNVPVPVEKIKEVFKKVEIVKEVPVIKIKEVIKKVEVIKEVTVEKIKEVIKKVEVIKEVPVIVYKTIEKIKVVEVKVPEPVIKIKEVFKEVEVIKEVPVTVYKTEIKEVEVIKEVPVEVIKEITLVREVEKEVIKEVKVVDNKALNALQAKYDALQVKFAAKPKTIIKEVPIEIVREIEVVKQIDFASLQKMMQGMKTVEVSKKVIGETRTKKEGKVVSRKEVKAGSRTTVKKDDLTKIEGIGPKISELLHAGGIPTFRVLANTAVKKIESILHAAGPRYQMHKPASWPKQAGLAADGKWDVLKKLQDELDGGK